jgi:uncharacterized protein (TIGR00369 family)
LRSRLSFLCGKIGGIKPPTNSTKADPQWERRVRESFLRQGLMEHLGAELVAVRAGECEIRARYRQELTQQHGYFYAGVTASIAGSASGYAAYSLMPADHSVLTVEYKINLVAPAAGDMLIARARVVRSGKTLKICAADVFAVKDGAENLCATSLSTIMSMAGKPDTPVAQKP